MELPYFKANYIEEFHFVLRCSFALYCTVTVFDFFIGGNMY